MNADRPLLDPDTLVDLLVSGEDMVLPVFCGCAGQPILIKSRCAARLVGVRNIAAVIAMQEFVRMNVEDAGVVLSAGEAAQKKTHIEEHERKLTRLVPEFKLCPISACLRRQILWLWIRLVWMLVWRLRPCPAASSMIICTRPTSTIITTTSRTLHPNRSGVHAWSMPRRSVWVHANMS